MLSFRSLHHRRELRLTQADRDGTGGLFGACRTTGRTKRCVRKSLLSVLDQTSDHFFHDLHTVNGPVGTVHGLCNLVAQFLLLCIFETTDFRAGIAWITSSTPKLRFSADS